MPGSPVKLGPFAGGINTLSDPTSVADQELVDCINFELDLDGSLKSRPPVVNLGSAPSVGNISLLGYFVLSTGQYYLLGSAVGWGLGYFDGSTWTLITADSVPVAFVQYQNNAWFIVDPANVAQNGGWWNPTAGWNSVADIPKGMSIVAHKNRLWISAGKTAPSNGARIRFSAIMGTVPNPATDWSSSTNFFDVSPGDGENVADIIVYQDSLIIFKTDSTWIFSYDSAPDKASLRRISATQGASDTHCVVPYENTLIVYHEGIVSELINFNYSKLNTKVPFSVDNALPQSFAFTVSLSLLRDRLIVRHFDRVYVYSLTTRSWTRWVTERSFAYFIVEPKNNTITDRITAFAGSMLTNDNSVYRIMNDFDSSSFEQMTCLLRTKNYDYELANFKKLYWWGADVVAQDHIEVMAHPIVFHTTVSWDQLDLESWDNFQTWDQMLTAIPVVGDTVETSGGQARKFLRFLRTLRFRQIYFTVSVDTDGSESRIAKVFNLTTYVDRRQSPSSKIS